MHEAAEGRACIDCIAENRACRHSAQSFVIYRMYVDNAVFRSKSDVAISVLYLLFPTTNAFHYLTHKRWRIKTNCNSSIHFRNVNKENHISWKPNWIGWMMVYSACFAGAKLSTTELVYSVLRKCKQLHKKYWLSLCIYPWVLPSLFHVIHSFKLEDQLPKTKWDFVAVFQVRSSESHFEVGNPSRKLENHMFHFEYDVALVALVNMLRMMVKL